MAHQGAFRPAAATVNIDVGASSAAVDLKAPACGRQIRVMNNGSATAWITFGKSDVAATMAAGIPVGPGVTEVLDIAEYDLVTHVAAIAAGSTGRIYFTPGEGL